MLKGTIRLRKILCIETSPPYDQVFESGVVPRLIAFLDPAAPENLQFESAWCLSNLASGTTAHTKEIVDKGALLPLIRLISSPNEDVSEQCIWACGNIAGEVKFRDEVLNNGIISYLIEVAQKSNTLAVLRNLCWTLSNLCRGTPPPPLHMVIPCLSVISTMIYHEDDEIVIDSLWALSYITATNEGIQCVVDSGLVKRIVELLGNPTYTILTPALKVIGNMASGEDHQAQCILDHGCLSIILPLFNHFKRGIRKESVWTASNIASGTPEQIQKLVDVNCFSIMVEIFENSSDSIIDKEIIWTLSNATHGSNSQVQHLIDVGCVGVFATYLKDSVSAKECLAALIGLENIFIYATEMENVEVMDSGIDIPTILDELFHRFKEDTEIVPKINDILGEFYMIDPYEDFIYDMEDDKDPDIDDDNDEENEDNDDEEESQDDDNDIVVDTMKSLSVNK